MDQIQELKKDIESKYLTLEQVKMEIIIVFNDKSIEQIKEFRKWIGERELQGIIFTDIFIWMRNFYNTIIFN